VNVSYRLDARTIFSTLPNPAPTNGFHSKCVSTYSLIRRDDHLPSWSHVKRDIVQDRRRPSRMMIRQPLQLEGQNFLSKGLCLPGLLLSNPLLSTLQQLLSRFTVMMSGIVLLSSHCLHHLPSFFLLFVISLYIHIPSTSITHWCS
jgi:hypothetical protein